MYGKIFESIFDSTLVADGGWLPTYVFMSMIVLADKDGYVDIAPKALYRRIGFRDYESKITYEDFEMALDYLQQEDAYSRSCDEGGKRLVPMHEIDGVHGNRGFAIVNYEYYRNRGSREDRARQSTERTRRWREKNPNKNNDETHGDGDGRMGRYTDTDTDTKKKGQVTLTARFDDFWKTYPRKRKKKPSREIWRRKKLDRIADQLIADVGKRLTHDDQWKAGFVPDPTTYLNQERWDDELSSGEITMTLDQEAASYDLTRNDGESDESLKQRLGSAMTQRRYSR